VFAVFQKARALMVAHELDEGRRIRLPVLREPLEILKDSPKASPREDAHRIFSVLVEVGVEDALVHEIGVLADVKEHPAQVVQLKHGEQVRSLGDALLNPFGIIVEVLLCARLDLGKDAKAVARRSLRENWTVSSLFHLVFE